MSFLVCFFVAWHTETVTLASSAGVQISEISLARPDDDISRLRLVDGLRSISVYKATERTGFYNHHPHIFRHHDMFFVAWSNHPKDEDATGQRVLLSVSRNGERWSLPASPFPPQLTERGRGLVLTANGWLQFEDELYAIADVHDDIGWTDLEGRVVSTTQTSRFHRAAQRAIGRLARKVNANRTMGELFWLSQDNVISRSCTTCVSRPVVAAKLNAALRLPLNRRTWDLSRANLHEVWIDRYPIKATDGHRLTEPTTYPTPDGTLVRLLRDLDRSYFIYVTVSQDAGNTWNSPRQTTIPDSPSRSFAGILPNGSVFLIGNPAKGRRDPLVIRLSRNGILFGKATILRRDSPPMRRRGRYKGPGFQYPAAVATNNALWVVYSVNKEDIEVSRISLPELLQIYADK